MNDLIVDLILDFNSNIYLRKFKLLIINKGKRKCSHHIFVNTEASKILKSNYLKLLELGFGPKCSIKPT